MGRERDDCVLALVDSAHEVLLNRFTRHHLTSVAGAWQCAAVNRGLVADCVPGYLISALHEPGAWGRVHGCSHQHTTLGSKVLAAFQDASVCDRAILEPAKHRTPLV